jgi:hypothetical protein
VINDTQLRVGRSTAIRRRLAVLTVIVVTLVWAGGAALAAGSQQVGSLGSGQSLFWSGTFVNNARVSDPSLCGAQGPCFDYTVNVRGAHATVLRVALRTADDSNGWQVELIDPSGQEVANGSTYTLDGVAEDFDVEVWAHKPAPGAWTVRVVPQNVVNGTFQMRAALDPVVKWPSSDPMLQTTHSVHVVKTCHTTRKGGRKVQHCTSKRAQSSRITARKGVYDIPPDLAADAPWHLTFDQPTPMVVVESGNFAAIAGLHNTNTSVAGQQTYDCLPEETIEQNAQRCLRFTSGFASLGPGKFEVYGSSSAPVAPNGGPLYQVVYRSNGTTYSRPAGSFAFHEIHAHYHVLGIAQFQIYRVAAPGKLVSAGTVLKEGFCLGDIKLYNWYSFGQIEINPNSSDNCEPAPQADGSWRFYEGIDAGWEDSYKWQTSGQFVNFANNPDGQYVLRVTVNPYHYILEADAGQDTNDVAYTYFQVTGSDIHVLERGHGYSPWDPHKQVENPVFGENR